MTKPIKESLLDKCKSIIDAMNYYDSLGYRIYILINLRSPEILKFIDKFIDMKSSDVNNDVLDVIENIIIHAKTIYEIEIYNDPYDDKLYDKMLSKFKKFRAEPFGNNGTGLANATYKYDKLSGTLDKTHFLYNDEKPINDTRDSLQDYFRSLPIDDYEEISVLVNQKKDGTSVTANYIFNDGKYIAESGISRGKKDYGEGTDVSILFKKLSFKPNNIKEVFGFLPQAIGVQYELVISNRQREAFEKFSGKRFANNRAAAAGLLRRILFASKKDLNVLRNFMSLVPVGFDILDDDIKRTIKTTWDKLYDCVCSTFIYGDVSMDYKIYHGTRKEILESIEKFSSKQLKKREKLDHAIDGLVVTVLNPELQQVLGRKNHINKWQVAYKFPEEGYKTVVRDFVITTGNFGYKELLLLVDPVILNGTKQFKAQVHSLDRLKKLDLHIGDEIILKLSGDVIPYGYKDNTCKSGKGNKIKFPKQCECGEKLVEEKNKMRCPNKKCPYRVVGSLVTFFTELNAKGIGDKTCEQLYDELGVRKPSDVLKLDKKDFRSLEGFKDASAKLAMDTITDIIKRPRSIASILSALGIDSFRTSTANKLLETIDIDTLISLIEKGDKENLIRVIRKTDGIDTNAQIIAEGLIANLDELKELLGMMTIKESKNVATDKVIVVSGFRPDDDFIDKANEKGYGVKDSGKKMDLLVVKDESYLDKSKGRYAQSKDIEIMTLKEFKEYIGI